MKITSDIYQVGGGGLSHSSDAASYIITSSGTTALIDAGTGRNPTRIIENIRNTGINPSSIKYLFLTHSHYDHTGGAEGIRELTGCSIVAHELDAAYLEMGDSEVTAASWYGTNMNKLKIDIKVTGRSMNFTLGDLEVIFHHTPGHSPGSSVLTVISGEQLVLFGQDVHGPLDPLLMSNRKDYRESLEFLLSLNADILCEGHYGVIKGKDKVKEFIRSFL